LGTYLVLGTTSLMLQNVIVYMLGTRLCVKIKIEREKERKKEWKKVKIILFTQKKKVKIQSKFKNCNLTFWVKGVKRVKEG